MNFFKDFFTNMEVLITNLIFFDYEKLISYLIFFIITYLITIYVINKKHKKIINSTNVEIKKINIEAAHAAKKKNILTIHIYLFVISGILIISKENLNIVLPVLTGLVILILFSMKEQLNNIFLGLLFKSNISTTIYEGMIFYFKETPNEVFVLSKINLFKSILKNKKTGQIESIENKDLNSKQIIHKPIDNLDYVEFKYIVPVNFNFDSYLIKVKKYFEGHVKERKDYTELKTKIFNVKEKYNTLPYLNPFYDIDIKYKSKDEIEILLKMTTYDYNYDKYIEDFLKLKPKLG